MAKKKGHKKRPPQQKKLSTAERLESEKKEIIHASASTKAGGKEEASQISSMFSIKSWKSFKELVSNPTNIGLISSHLRELEEVRTTPEFREAPKSVKVLKEKCENDIKICEILLKTNNIVSSSENPTKKLVHELIKELGTIIKNVKNKYVEKSFYDLCIKTLWKAYNLYETLPSSNVAKEKSEFYKKYYSPLYKGSKELIQAQLDYEYFQLVAKEKEQKGDKPSALEAYFNSLESLTFAGIATPKEKSAICQKMCITYQTLYHLIDTKDQISKLQGLVSQNKASPASKDYGFLLCAKAMHDLGDYANALEIVEKVSSLHLKNSTILKYQIILAKPIDNSLYSSTQLLCGELMKNDDIISIFFIMQELFETIFLHYTSIRDIDQMLLFYKMIPNSILMQHEIVKFYVERDDLTKAKEFIENEKIDLTSANIPTLFKIEAVALYNALGDIASASTINDSLPEHLKQDLANSDSESDAEETPPASPDEEPPAQDKEAAAGPAQEIVIERPAKKVKFTALDARRIESEAPEDVSFEEYAAYYKFKAKMAKIAAKAEHGEALSETQISIPSWHIGDSSFVYTKESDCIFHLGKNIYAVIKPELEFEPATKAQLNNALNKGFVRRAKGENGVKFVGKTAVEIKISSEMRLYTGTKFINEAGDELLVFDKFGNHAEVSKFANENKQISEIDVVGISIPTEAYHEQASEAGAADAFDHLAIEPTQLMGNGEE